MKTRNKHRNKLHAAKQKLKHAEEEVRQEYGKRLAAEMKMQDMMQVVRERDERLAKLVGGPARYFRYDQPPSPEDVMQTWRYQGGVRICVGVDVSGVRQHPQGESADWLNEICLDFGRRAYEEAKRQLKIVAE